MTFNIPVPEDRSGEMIGQGLANAVYLIEQGRANKRARKEHEEDRAHGLKMRGLQDATTIARARESGIMEGTAPHEDLDLNVPNAEMPAFDPRSATMRPRGHGLASAMSADFDRVNGFPRGEPPAAITPGSFVPGRGFHSPLRDGSLTQPGNAPTATQRSDSGTTLHFTPRYQQLTPDYYEDRDAPAVAGARLASALGNEKLQAEIDANRAHADYYRGRANYPAGRPRTPLRTSQGYYDQDAQDYVRDVDGNVLKPYAATRTAASPVERSARADARASREDAQAFATRANQLERPLLDPRKAILSDTTDFPTRRAMGDTSDFAALRQTAREDAARRDSVTAYRARSDSARAAARGYDLEADRASGVRPPPSQTTPGATTVSGSQRDPRDGRLKTAPDSVLIRIMRSVGKDKTKIKRELARLGYDTR